MKVRIVQCLCPQRHCMMAVSYESPNGEADPSKTEMLRNAIDELVQLHVVNPWCGICGSCGLNYEDRETRFGTTAEAEPELKAMEEAQERTALFLKRSRN
jgi:hypothetical protein